MNTFLLSAGRLVGVCGLLLCLVSFAARLSGHYFLGGFQVGTLLLGGVAAMMAGCFCLLVVMTATPKAEVR
jgi:hypothetical protein